MSLYGVFLQGNEARWMRDGGAPKGRNATRGTLSLQNFYFIFFIFARNRGF